MVAWTRLMKAQRRSCFQLQQPDKNVSLWKFINLDLYRLLLLISVLLLVHSFDMCVFAFQFRLCYGYTHSTHSYHSASLDQTKRTHSINRRRPSHIVFHSIEPSVCALYGNNDNFTKLSKFGDDNMDLYARVERVRWVRSTAYAYNVNWFVWKTFAAWP